MKKFASILLVTMFIISLIFPTHVYATEVNQLPRAMGIDMTSVESIKEALKQVDLHISAKDDSLSKSVILDNGYQITISISKEVFENRYSLLARSSTRRKLTSKCEIKNIFGTVIATLTAVGVFDTNGATSKPYKAYGTSSVRDVKNIENVLGASQHNSWVRISFAGTLPTGAYSVNYKCTIYCDANGNNSVSWE